MEILYENLLRFGWQDIVMILLGCLLIYLAIKKEMEPSLLLPMGLGTILVNIPGSTALVGPIQELYEAGIANELFPLILFIGIGSNTETYCKYRLFVGLSLAKVGAWLSFTIW